MRVLDFLAEENVVRVVQRAVDALALAHDLVDRHDGVLEAMNRDHLATTPIIVPGGRLALLASPVNIPPGVRWSKWRSACRTAWKNWPIVLVVVRFRRRESRGRLLDLQKDIHRLPGEFLQRNQESVSSLWGR